MAGLRSKIPGFSLLFLCLTFIHVPLPAQTGWFLNPLPSGNSYYGVSFPDSNHGWCVGEAGIIVRTTDGGASWLFDESGTDTTLNAVHMLDQTHGWAAGENTILGADQRGYWRVQTHTVPASLKAIRFLDALRGWTCGDSLLLATTDGGTTWSASRLPGASDLKSLAIADPQHLWLAGDSCLFRSTNGGQSWDRFVPDSLFRRVDFQKVLFSSPAAGWLIGTEHFPAWPNAVKFAGIMLKTTDSGATWAVTLADTLQYSFFYPRNYFYDVVFADTLSGYYASRHGTFATNDGGATWDSVNAGTGDHYAMPSAQRLFAAGDRGHLSRSDDRGKSWQELSRGTRATVKSLRYDPAANRTLAGVSFDDFTGSLLLQTANLGFSWDTVSTFKEAGNINLTGLSFVDSLHGWASAVRYYSGTFTRNAGIILSTTDGGKSWKRQLDDSSYNQLWSIHFIDLRHGVAAGTGLILYTVNGGETWLSRYSDPLGQPEFKTAFLKDSTTIWCGGNDRIISSSDAGLTWKRRDSLLGLPYFTINGIQFRGNQGWMVGAISGFAGTDGIVLTTTDGGQSWTNALLVPRRSLNAIDAWVNPGLGATPLTAMAVGDGGACAVSQGGRSWHTVHLPHTRTYLDAVVVAGTFWFFTAGESGKILYATLLGPDAVAIQKTTPAEFHLEQNYPNPFNPATTITYSIARQTHVKLVIYDLLGREVATLVDELQGPGLHRVRWSPRGLSSGVYFYRLTTLQASRVRKMVFLE